MNGRRYRGQRMPQPRRIALLGVHTLATRLIAYSAAFVGAALIARGLGPHGRGLYTVPIAFATIVMGLSTAGLELAQVRLWAQRGRSRSEWVGSAAVLALPIGVGAAAVSWLVYGLLRSGPFKGITPLEMGTIIVLLPIWTHAVLIRGLLVIDGRLATVNRALMLGDLSRTAAVIALFVLVGLTVENVLAVYALLVGVPWVICLRAIGWREMRRPPPGLVREQLSAGVRLAPHFLFLTLNLRLDVLLVAAIAGPREVGLYAVAVLVAELVWLPTWALSQATKEAQAGADPVDAGLVTARGMRMTLVLSVLCGVGLAAAAPVGVTLVFGSDFSAALTALWILLPASAGMAVWRLLTVFLARVAPIRVTAGIALAA